MNRTRRDLLKASAGLAAAGGLAGCTERLEAVAADGPTEDGGYAAFFTLYDFARTVGGDAFEFENPVPAGTMGHRWEPSSDLPAEIASHRAFVYMGVEGFQRWALDTADVIERDHPEVALIDVLDGVDLREYDRDDADHGDDSHDHHDDGHDDDDDHDDDAHHDDGHDDDHADSDREPGNYDPHYWTDPLKAVESVEIIADGLAEADPENADVYRANAEAYVDELGDLHRAFEEALADREHDTVVVAAHDSYQYLAERYDFEIHSPVGVSPHAEPSQDEIADTIELVDDAGIDVILADYFEPDTLAETIVRESDAEEIVQLSPAEGTTEEWNERGWGYVEQMKEVNLPALEAALETRD